MRRKYIASLALLLAVVLFVSVIFGSSIVNVSRLSFFGPLGGTQGATTVFVDPAYFYRDYSLLPVGSKFTVHVNVSDVTDLFTWQVNMTWNPSILNLSRVITGPFLNQTTSANKTSSAPAYFGGLGYVMSVKNNSRGYVAMTESILEDALPGSVSGISGSGRLVSVEFLVVGYGSCDLVLDTVSSLATTLLSSTGVSLTFSKANGYFSNKAIGDVNGDRHVNGVDFGIFAPSYGSSLGQPAYKRECDLNHEGHIDGVDFGMFAPNYGRSV